MSTKIKNTKHPQTDKREAVISHIGLSALSLAAVLTVVQLHHARPPRSEARVTPPASSLIHSIEVFEAEVKKDLKKEKDKIRHHTVVYGSPLRSHSTAGTI